MVAENHSNTITLGHFLPVGCADPLRGLCIAFDEMVVCHSVRAMAWTGVKDDLNDLSGLSLFVSTASGASYFVRHNVLLCRAGGGLCTALE
jgi:hypothetical protein